MPLERGIYSTYLFIKYIYNKRVIRSQQKKIPQGNLNADIPGQSLAGPLIFLSSLSKSIPKDKHP